MSLEPRTITMRSVAALLGLLIAVTAAVIGAVVGSRYGLDLRPEQTLTVLAWAVPAHGVLIFLAVHLWLRRLGLPWAAIGFRRPTWQMGHLLWQTPLVLIAAVVTNVVFLNLVGRTDQVEGDGVFQEVAQDVNTLAAVGLLLGIVIAGPVWEEAVFRGVLYSALWERMALVWVVFITAGVFAVVHVTPLLMPYLVVMGIALALLRAFHQNLWAPLIVHAIINFLASITVLSVILAA